MLKIFNLFKLPNTKVTSRKKNKQIIFLTVKNFVDKIYKFPLFFLTINPSLV